MPFDLEELLRTRHGENFELHAKYLNPQLTKVVKTIGFDRFYERGEGCYLIDDDGTRYLDMLSGFGVFALGRSHPVIKDALHQAIDADLPNMVQIDSALLPGLLAEQLVNRSPANIERAFFCNSGAEAVEAAIKFARASTKRDRILFLSHAYHGLTMGALSLNGSKDFREGFGPLLPGATEVPFGDLEALKKELARGDVAALIVEPIQGKGVYELEPERMASDRSGCARSGRPLHLRRSADGHRANRQVLRLRALRTYAGHHHRLQGVVRRLRARGGDARERQDLSQRVLLDGARHGALDDVQGQPTRHGRGSRDAASLRRRGHRRARRRHG